MIVYFAYGSNMLTDRLRERVEAAKLGVAHIAGRKLTFHKPSIRKDGARTGKCDIPIQTDPNSIVYGVLFQMTEKQFDELNEYEKGYSTIELSVHSYDLGVAKAIAHVADTTDATLIPYDWYRDLVLEGAREHKLPEYYVREQIQNVRAEDSTGSTYKDAKAAKALLKRVRERRAI